MPSWCTSACGLRRCAKPWTPLSTTRRSMSPVRSSLSLYKGNIGVAGRHSPYSLYSDDLSSFTMGDSYDQKDAKGFIQILGLPARTRARLLQKKEAVPVKMWSGRFREPLDHDFEQWQRSLAFDWQLLPQEVAASKAHARTIAAAGILTADGAGKDCGRAGRDSRRVCAAAAQRHLRLHRRRKTFTTSWSSSWWRGSATWALSCTPAAAATSRLPPTSGSLCGRSAHRSPAAWRTGCAR